MPAPAFAGPGASVFEIARTGDDDTVVVITAPATGAVSLLSMLSVEFVINVPFASGLVTCTTTWTTADAPALTLPMVLLISPADRLPPAVADTKVVFAGTVSAITTPLAFADPVFENDRV